MGGCIDEHQPSPFVKHVVELRRRLLLYLFITAIVFLGLLPISDRLYIGLAGPLLRYLPEGHTLIATGLAAPFLVPLKLTVIVTFFITIPVLFYQIWAFVAPGLYQYEKKWLRLLLVSSIVLFYIGMAFAYWVVFPLVFNFLLQIVPTGIRILPDIGQYLNFTLVLLFAFGFAFEVPLITVLLIKTGVVSREGLVQKRPYIIVTTFVLGMIFTPPDVLSQILLAIPLWLLFEAGLVISRVMEQK